MLAGFLLAVEGQYDIGDTIQVNAPGVVVGVVEELTLRTTRVRAPDGSVWFLCNGDIRAAANTTRTGWALATVDVTVPAATDLSLFLRALEETGAAVYADERYAPACTSAPVPMGVVATSVDSVTARLTARTTPEARQRLEHGLREEAMRRLQAAGVFSAAS